MDRRPFSRPQAAQPPYTRPMSTNKPKQLIQLRPHLSKRYQQLIPRPESVKRIIGQKFGSKLQALCRQCIKQVNSISVVLCQLYYDFQISQQKNGADPDFVVKTITDKQTLLTKLFEKLTKLFIDQVPVLVFAVDSIPNEEYSNNEFQLPIWEKPQKSQKQPYYPPAVISNKMNTIGYTPTGSPSEKQILMIQNKQLRQRIDSNSELYQKKLNETEARLNKEINTLLKMMGLDNEFRGHIINNTKNINDANVSNYQKDEKIRIDMLKKEAELKAEINYLRENDNKMRETLEKNKETYDSQIANINKQIKRYKEDIEKYERLVVQLRNETKSSNRQQQDESQELVKRLKKRITEMEERQKQVEEDSDEWKSKLSMERMMNQKLNHKMVEAESKRKDTENELKDRIYFLEKELAARKTETERPETHLSMLSRPLKQDIAKEMRIKSLEEELAQLFGIVAELKETVTQKDREIICLKSEKEKALKNQQNQFLKHSYLAAKGQAPNTIPFKSTRPSSARANNDNNPPSAVKSFLQKQELSKKLQASRVRSNTRVLLTPQQQSLLNNMLARMLKILPGKLLTKSLIFDAKASQFSEKAFHESCDGKAGLLIVCKTTTGYSFGGYIDDIFTNGINPNPSFRSFMFSLTHGLEMLLISGRQAFQHDQKYGPRFGVYDCTIQSNKVMCSGSSMNSFQRKAVEGLKYSEVLAGDSDAQLQNYEVYLINIE